MSRIGWSVALGAGLALGATGCEGPSETPRAGLFGSAGSSQTQGGMSAATAGPTPEGFLPEAAPRSAPLRRLTRAEYRNVIGEVLGVEPPAAYALPEDSLSSGFSSTADQLTTIAAANRYLDAALETGERLLPTIRELVPCDASELAAESACIDDWLTTFGSRLFRRPISEDEKERYLAAFERARANESYEQSVSVVVEALLIAPELLFIELPSGGEPGSKHELDSWQVASRLSLLLWDSIPDQALLSAAEHGELTSRAALAEQLERMLLDPRAQQVVRSFFDDWLGLSKIENVGSDPDAYPVLSRELAAALAEETRSYAENVFWQGDFRRLFVSSTRFRNLTLSQFYADKLSSNESVTGYESDLTEQRFGLLSQAGFLMTLARSEPSLPIYRGAFVRRKLLCGRLKSAPPGVAIPLPEPSAGLSKRERITEHTSGGNCVGCHGAFNPLGFALEHFDVAGAWRETEEDLPIDTRVTFDEPGLRAEVDGARQLSEALAESPSARACAVQELFTFALERPPTSHDLAWFDELGQSFEASGFDLKTLLTELVSSDDFRSRIEPEELP